MVVTYLYWHYVAAPQWLAIFFVNSERFLARAFSVPLLLRTLLSPWHRDIVEYRGGISDRLFLLAWNLISRGIGFLVRATVLLAWAALTILWTLAAGVFVILFFAAPLLIATATIVGILFLAAAV